MNSNFVMSKSLEVDRDRLTDKAKKRRTLQKQDSIVKLNIGGYK